MDGTERRKDHGTAETIERALQTRRAFDEMTAIRFLATSGVSAELAQQVIERRPDHLRNQAVHHSRR